MRNPRIAANAIVPRSGTKKLSRVLWHRYAVRPLAR